MEALNKLTTGLIILFLFLSSAEGYSQDKPGLVSAFSESYTLEEEGDYSGAAEKLRKVYDETSYELNARMGWLTYMSGNFTEAVSFYRKAIELKPYALEPRFGLVLPESALGNWSSVMKQYEAILKTDPMNTIALYRLGMIYYGMEDYEVASKQFEKVVNLYPFDYDSVIMFAWSQFKMAKLREAKVLFNKALLIRPGDESAMEGLGLIQ